MHADTVQMFAVGHMMGTFASELATLTFTGQKSAMYEAYKCSSGQTDDRTERTFSGTTIRGWLSSCQLA